MATRLQLSFYGDRQLDRTLAKFNAAKDMRPAWQSLAARFTRMEAKQFGSQGGFGSGGWAPLSPRYAAWKAKHYPGKGILVRTGELRRSLTQRPLGTEVLEKSFMVIGSNVEYGAHHQRGGGLPRRRPVEFPDAERRAWVKVMHRFLQGNGRS